MVRIVDAYSANQLAQRHNLVKLDNIMQLIKERANNGEYYLRTNEEQLGVPIKLVQEELEKLGFVVSHYMGGLVDISWKNAQKK